MVFVGARRSSPGMREVQPWEEEKEGGVGPPAPEVEEDEGPPIAPVSGVREVVWRGSSKELRSAFGKMS
jgi:hypothetical protein